MMSRTILIHQWIGMLIMVLAIAGLTSSVWSIVQNVFLYEAPIPPLGIPEIEKVQFHVPSLGQRIGWNVSGLLMFIAIFVFGFWTYRKGKDGVPLISIR
jgi:hypothetical protein